MFSAEQLRTTCRIDAWPLLPQRP